MFKTSKLILVFIGFIFLSCSDDKPENKNVNEEQDNNKESVVKTYEIVPEESFIEWTGSKPTEDHVGTLNVLSSAIEIQGNQVSGGELVVDMNSLKVTDIKDPQANKKLLDHLKNEDFFSVTEYPAARFSIQSSRSEEGNNVVLGDLEMKGISNSAEITYNVKRNSNIIVIEGEHTFDRTLYDIKYKSKSVFGDLGDKFINDEIRLKFNLVLIDPSAK